MQPIKLKETKAIEFNSLLKEYINKNSCTEGFDENAKSFVTNFHQSRKAMTNISNKIEKVAQLKENKDILIKYINQLIIIKSKMTFGKEEHSLKVKFIWTDSGSGSKISSYEINFEYYNTLYNLAATYFLISSSLSKDLVDSEDSLEDISNSYRNAFAIFELIGSEVKDAISQKEIPFDLSANYMQYGGYLSIINGQIFGLKELELKKTDQELQAQMAYGISSYYQKAYSCFNNMPMSKYNDEKFKNYLFNRSIYYQAQMFFRLRDLTMNVFDSTGNNFGDVIVYQGRAVEKLMECKNHLIKFKTPLKADEGTKLIEEEKIKGEEMYEKNKKIIHDIINEKLETNVVAKIVFTAGMPTEGEFNPNDKSKDGNCLVSKELNEIISRYQEKITEIIKKELDQLESDEEIEKYINDLDLPPHGLGQEQKARECPFLIGINDQGWIKINGAINMGGVPILGQAIQSIARKSYQMEKILKNLGYMLNKEEREDNYYRQQFSDNKWLRKPSNQLNGYYINTANIFGTNIMKTKQYDLKEKNDCSSIARFCEMAFQPGETINKKISSLSPGEKIVKQKEGTEDDKKLKQNVINLKEFCLETKKGKDEIFEMGNNNSSLTSKCLLVLNKKTTETLVLEEDKLRFRKKFQEVQALREKINDNKHSLEFAKMNGKGNREKVEDVKMPLSIQEYLFNLNKFSDLFLNKMSKLRKGYDYYQAGSKKIDELAANTQDYIAKRSSERDILLQVITGRPVNKNQVQTGSNKSNDEFLNPNNNLYTNMGVTQYAVPNNKQETSQQYNTP